MGAQVEIAVGGENLVQRMPLTPRTASSALPGDESAPAPTAWVKAEGLPNLLHELVHAVQAGRLDDDYGIDYQAIPFDLAHPEGREVLWQELSCCVISCAYLAGYGRTAQRGGDSRAVDDEVRAWFREQVEIQPVFYGMEDDPPAFVGRVGELLDTHHAEAADALQAAYAATERALLGAGAKPALAAAPQRPTMAKLWAQLPSPASREERP